MLSTIEGTVVDERNSPVPFASIALYKETADSTFVKGIASNEEGKFQISIKPGSYFLKVSFLSFQENIISNIIVGNDRVDVGKIMLIPSITELGEVEVIAEKEQIELNLDKRIFNVGNDLTNAGRNAIELLDNVPSVSVDVDGNVSLRGSQNVRVLIDGKPSGLVGISSTDALRQLQGSMIERLEVITNPSARYDAEGEVGIINIVLKKGRNQGLNGSFELVGGYPDNHSASINLNYKKKWINLFTSYGVNYRNSPGSGYSIQQFTGDSTYSFERFRDRERGGLANNFRLGSEVYLNDWNTLTISGLYKISDGENKSVLTYRDFDQSNALVNTSIRTDNEQEDGETVELALSYKKTFSQKGREWTADLKWINNDDSEFSNVLEVSDTSFDDLRQEVSNTEDERTWFFQTDYIHPIGKNGKLETGVRINLRSIENDYSVKEKEENGEFFILPDFNNFFVYQEDIYAGYLMFGNKVKDFSYQLGLRAEYSDISTELLKTNEINDRDYLNLFPSAHFSYELDKSNTLQLSYSRRLSRPRFRHLLPFFNFSDNRNFFSGNPNLNPEYTNSFELGHLNYFKNGSILSSIYYRYRTGVIERITEVDDSGLILIFPINLSTQNAYGLEFNVGYDVDKWWKLNGNFNFYRAITDGVYEEQDFYSDTYSWTARFSSKLTILKTVDFQTIFNYSSPRITTQGKSLSMYSLNLGASMDILKKKGTLMLSVRDLLNSRKRRSIVESEGFYSESEFQWRARQILLSFSYRLNQKKQRSRENGLNDNSDGDF